MEKEKREEKKAESLENIMPELENIERIFSEFNKCLSGMFNNAREIIRIATDDKKGKK